MGARPTEWSTIVAGRKSYWEMAGKMNRLGKVVAVVFAFLGSAYADPPLPVISNQVFVVTNTAFAGGAYGNGSSNNAAAINAAIAFASTNGGGTVEIPPVGTLTNYLSGPITMASHVNLQIDSGAMLQMLPMSMWTGTTTFINGATLTDVEISGSGTIDGQGTNWWLAYHSSKVSRPNFVEFDHCTRVLIQNVTLQNPPTFHIYLKNSDTSVTIQGITINTPYDSPNTDGSDISSTNVLIRNCSISDGDDNLEIGGSGAVSTDITVSNCTFGTGHGVSIGSKIAAGVNNLTVSNCSWNGTEYGIHIKSDRGIGGLVQNLKYCDLTMTNVNLPIAIYMDYNAIGAPMNSISVTPANATTNGPQSVTSTTPIYENITISNLTAVGNSSTNGPGNIAGFMYGLPESLISNVTLCEVNISSRTNADGTFCMYDVTGVQIIDSNLTAPTTGTNTLTLYNAQVTVTNSAPNPNLVTLGGLAVPPTNNVVAFFNTQAASPDISMMGPNPLLTLGSSTLTVNNNVNLGSLSTLNFGLGTNATTIASSGNLTVGGTLNVSDGGGFTNTVYTLFTYGGTLTYNGVTIGATPDPSLIYTVSTSTVGQVDLIVSNRCSAIITLSPSNLPNATVSCSYTQTISVTGSGDSFTYAVSAGTLPTGLSLSSGGVISGTPTVTGSSTFTVLATDTNTGCVGQQSYSLNVVCPTVTLSPNGANPTVLNGGTAGTNYSQTITASGGCGTYTFATTSGALPTGLSLSSAGVLSGTPTVPATYTFTVTATDSSGCDGGQNYSLTIICPTISLSPGGGSPQVLTTGTGGANYSQTITASGGIGTYTYAITSGALPTGLSLSSAGVLSGAPTVVGTHTFTVTATDSAGCTGGQNYSLTINCPTITLSPSGANPTVLNGGTAGTAYSTNITASGGIGTYTYAITSGALPTGLSLSSAGVLSGTPTVVGTYTFTVTATDSAGCTGAQNYSLTVICPTITLSPNGANPTVLNGGTVGANYSQTITASGGIGTYTYAITSGTLPTGLSLSSAGVLSGSPTASGTHTFTVTATDSAGCTGGQNYSLTVICPTITLSPSGANPTVLNGGTVGAAYSTNITASGGIGTYTYAITSGALPTGLSLSSAGALSGTPTVAAAYTFTVTATDTRGCTGSQDYSVTMTCPTLTLSATGVTLPAKGGSKHVRVKANGADCAWTAVSNDPYITITSGSSGTGDGNVVYAVLANTNTTALTGTMTIAGQIFTVSQDGGGCTFSLSPKHGKFKAAGGSATVKVKPNFSDCSWTVVKNNAFSFITITDVGSGVAAGTVSYTVAPNSDTLARTGSITIGGKVFIITQDGAK